MMGFYGICKWKGCNKKAVFEAPLDFPHIWLCVRHYRRHRRLAKQKRAKIYKRCPTLKVDHPSFSDLQRERYLKEVER